MAASASLRLVCGSREQFRQARANCKGRILGAIAYAEVEPSFEGCDFPCAWVALPALDGGDHYEMWISALPVTRAGDARLAAGYDGRLLFGCLAHGETSPDELETQTFEAYSAIFDMLDRIGYPELLRVWNYFPGINDTGRGMERYREFNIGRHKAFCHNRRAIGEGCVPAACALGTRHGKLVVCFLAGKQPGIVVENPRQTSAYRYPGKFGPKSPTFSRGVLLDGALLTSGTASIVGSATLHPENVMRQLDETLVNLKVVADQARSNGFAERDHAHLCLNVYIRRQADYPAVRDRVAAAFDGAHIVYLKADVCRADLLVEIEAFWIPDEKGLP